MKSDIDTAVNAALEAMRVSGCHGCHAFSFCRERLLALRGAGSLRLDPPWREKATDKKVNVSILGFIFRLFRRNSARTKPARSRPGKYTMVFAALLFPLFLLAAVRCTWNGSGYDCSGYGGAVIVEGGGPLGGEGSGETVIVTNVVGTCTNCVAMSPDYVRSWKSDASNFATSTIDALSNISNAAYDIEVELSDQITYIQNAPVYTGTFATGAGNVAVRTNFLYNVAQPYGGDFWTATETIMSQHTNGGNINVERLSYTGVGAWNGAVSYANSTLPSLNQNKISALSIQSNSGLVRSNLEQFRDQLLPLLSDEVCTMQYDGPPTGDACGSGAVTNQFNGNWCTYDQGEAIKDLLNDLKTWTDKQLATVQAISNNVHHIRETLQKGLYSDYTAVPRNTDWQDVYLSGSPTGWGYDPTNVLQRIELLVYGISGISTNESAGGEWEEDTTPDPDEFDMDALNESLSGFQIDADSQELETFGQALIGFVNAFGGSSGDSMHVSDMILEDAAIELNGQHYTIPGLTTSDNSSLVGIFNQFQTTVRMIFTVSYFIAGAVLIFLYWRWFAAWCFKFAHWLTEICTSLFSD